MNNLKKKSAYPYNDQIVFELNEENDIRFRVINNEKGSFVDIRKFFNDKPSPKGIRMSVDVFERIYKAYMKSDYDKMKDEDNKESNTPSECDRKPVVNAIKKLKK